MEFEALFREWLHDSLSGPLPTRVRAFSFNLYEPVGEPGVKFGIELIGASRFDAKDPDWPCSEAWEPSPRGITMPVCYSGEHWQECLDKIKRLLVFELESDSPAAKILKSVEAIGIGFVDGDLNLAWQR